MARYFEDISAPEAIKPIAQPVDTYVRPPDPAPSALHGLAEGLGDLAAGLSGVLGQRDAKAKEEEALQAENAAHLAQGVGWAEAVKRGLVPAQASKNYMRAWKTAQGNLAGVKLQSDFNRAYSQWPGRNANDPAAFDEFRSKWLTDNIAKDVDPDVLKGLNPHVRQLWANSQDAYTQDTDKAVRDGAKNTQGALVKATADSAVEQAAGGEVDTKGLWDEVMQYRDAQTKVGMAEEDYDEAMVNSILLKAVESNRPELLDVLKNKIPGTDRTYEDDPRFAGKVLQARDDIGTLGRQRVADQEKAAEKAQQDRLLAVRSKIHTMIADPEFKTVPEEDLREAEKAGWYAVRTDVPALRKEFMNATKAPPNEEELLRLQIGASDGTVSVSEIDRAAKNGLFSGDLEGYRKIRATAQEVAESKAKGGGITQSPTATATRRAIIQQIVAKDGTVAEGILSQMTGDPNIMPREGLEFTRDFNNALLKWEAAQDPNDPELAIKREDYIFKLGEAMGRRINSTLDPNDPAKYMSDQDQVEADVKLQERALEPPNAAQQAIDRQIGELDKERLGGGQPTEEDNVRSFVEGMQERAAELRDGRNTARIYGRDKAPALEELPEDSRKYLEDAAKRVGMSTEEFNMKLWESIGTKIKEGLDNGDPTTKIATTTEELGESLEPGAQDTNLGNTLDLLIDKRIEDGLMMQTIPRSTNQEVGLLLDMLGDSEKTDKGRGYDETLAYGAYTGGPVDLTKMTLKEIDKLQTQMLAHPKNKLNSSAVGRYQIVRRTLRPLVKKLGLTGDELFDKDMQDRLGLELLKGRGYEDWKAGRITDNQFMNNLAQEWASVPTTSGQGYYEGQRRTPIKPKDVLAVFQQLRTGPGTTTFGQTIPKAYAKIPANEQSQFMEWNSDPEANSEKTVASVKPELGKVYKAAEKALAAQGIKIVAASGHRDEETQKKAVKNGWSKTMDSNHKHGDALDVWVIGEDGAIDWDPEVQEIVAEAMKAAANSLNVKIGWGGSWKGFKDRPHFQLEK